MRWTRGVLDQFGESLRLGCHLLLRAGQLHNVLDDGLVYLAALHLGGSVCFERRSNLVCLDQRFPQRTPTRRCGVTDPILCPLDRLGCRTGGCYLCMLLFLLLLLLLLSL